MIVCCCITLDSKLHSYAKSYLQKVQSTMLKYQPTYLGETLKVFSINTLWPLTCNDIFHILTRDLLEHFWQLVHQRFKSFEVSSCNTPACAGQCWYGSTPGCISLRTRRNNMVWMHARCQIIGSFMLFKAFTWITWTNATTSTQGHTSSNSLFCIFRTSFVFCLAASSSQRALVTCAFLVTSASLVTCIFLVPVYFWWPAHFWWPVQFSWPVHFWP